MYHSLNCLIIFLLSWSIHQSVSQSSSYSLDKSQPISQLVCESFPLSSSLQPRHTSPPHPFSLRCTCHCGNQSNTTLLHRVAASCVGREAAPGQPTHHSDKWLTRWSLSSPTFCFFFFVKFLFFLFYDLSSLLSGTWSLCSCFWYQVLFFLSSKVSLGLCSLLIDLFVLVSCSLILFSLSSKISLGLCSLLSVNLFFSSPLCSLLIDLFDFRFLVSDSLFSIF